MFACDMLCCIFKKKRKKKPTPYGRVSKVKEFSLEGTLICISSSASVVLQPATSIAFSFHSNLVAKLLLLSLFFFFFSNEACTILIKNYQNADCRSHKETELSFKPCYIAVKWKWKWFRTEIDVNFTGTPTVKKRTWNRSLMRKSIVKSTDALLCQGIIWPMFSSASMWNVPTFLSLSMSQHTHKNNNNFHDSTANFQAAIAETISTYTNKWPFSHPLILWFIPNAWLVPGVSSLLIGLIQRITLADWSESKQWFSWFVLFRSSGVRRSLNHLTALIIAASEPSKLVQSKAWLDESVV